MAGYGRAGEAGKRGFLSADSAKRRLAPLMRLWRAGIETKLEQTPRPYDEPHVSARGPNSDRILLFGAGMSVGWGVTTHDLALPGFLARALSSLTKRGTDVDVVSHPANHLDGALARLSAMRLWRYDAIVIVLGVNEALELAPTKKWRSDLTELLTTLAEIAPVPVVFTAIPRVRSIRIYDSALGGLAEDHGFLLNEESAEVCAAAPHAIFLPLPALAFPAPHRHRGPDSYAGAAQVIAAALAPALARLPHQPDDPYRPFPYDEDRAEMERQAAVDALDLSDSDLGRALDEILGIAQTSLQVRTAVLTVLDHDKQVIRASARSPVDELPRAGSFCDTTIRLRGGLVIPDAQQDERFRDYPLVAGEPGIRYYAGFPIESPSGERIGALCVFDPEPRDSTDDADLARLRDLALLMQRRLRASA
ncbi:GAF domain-containing protein [Parafrigoribacterium soli]|uniref:GAF domain-containing protein n=1 Tax=Parafrigoribacterium soli TaxID=3144663 RepID=UPI0032EF8A4F